MATTITMPQLGETVTEGTVAQWLKTVGDSVEKYEDFVEVSTDKVNAGVPSPVTGTIRELLVKEGETVATGTPIAVIDEVGAAKAAAQRRRSLTAPSPPQAPSGPTALSRAPSTGTEGESGDARRVAGRTASGSRASRRHSRGQRQRRERPRDCRRYSRRGALDGFGPCRYPVSLSAASGSVRRRSSRELRERRRTRSRFQARSFRSRKRGASSPNAWSKAVTPRRTRGR